MDLVKILIAKGGNLLVCNAEGVTPLDICVKSFGFGKVQSILTCVTSWKDILFSDGKTKLVDYISVLHDPDSHEKFLQNTSEAVRISLPKDSLIWPGYTILHIAVTLLPGSKEDRICEILRYNADVTSQDSYGTTPIHLAFRRKTDMLWTLLCRHHKDVNPLDQDNLSHLHIACALNHTNLVKSLLTIEANVDIAYKGRPLPTVKPGWTPLHIACFTDHFTITKMLVAAGVNLLKTDVAECTPIHRLFGTNGKKNQIIDCLVASKQFKECVAEGIGLTHLHVMTYWNKTEVVQQLLDSGSDIEAAIGEVKDEHLRQFVGCRPLHAAVMNHHSETVELLFERGANIFAKRPNGTFPLSDVLTSKYKEPFVGNFVSLLWTNEKYQKRMKKEMDLTMLHVACYALDIEKIKILLEKKVDVNARIRDDSPIWPGLTPLLVLTSLGVSAPHRADMQVKVEKSIKLLLNNKADVTLANPNGETPVLLNLKYRYKEQGKVRLGLLIKHHRNFDVNPTNKEGVSHFHIACSLCNPVVVEGFLKNGADPNQPVGESDGEFAGKFPLHLALNASAKRMFGVEILLETVKVLLEHGAKVDSVDARGWTPLHNVAECGPSRQKLLDQIIRKNTDINQETFNGETPFEIMIQSGASIKEIKYFINQGSRVNTYNRITNKGYMEMIISNSKYEKLSGSITALMMSLPDIAEVDERGRNSIHNAVCGSSTYVHPKALVVLIENLIKLGCDIHQQDRDGKTSLHIAVEEGNERAVDALLMSGADVNLVDSAGQSPFSYSVKPSSKSKDLNDRVSSVSAALSAHLRELQLVGLRVSQLNIRLLAGAQEMSKIERMALHNQVNETKKIQIGQRGRTLYDFVFQKDEGRIISLFTPAERDIVGKVLQSIDYYEKFSSLRHLLKLQYRKVLERLTITAPAAESFITLLGLPLPDLCVEIVFKFLTNVELKCLVSAKIKSGDLEMVTN